MSELPSPNQPGKTSRRVAEPNRYANSWRRCRETYELDPGKFYETSVLEAAKISQLREKLEDIYPVAEKEVESLYLQSPRRGFVAILTDPHGTVLKTCGDPSLDENFKKSDLLPGANWAEKYRGTNGIGTAIEEQRALTVFKSEHYFRAFSGLTCSAAPFHDHNGNLLGVLNISSFPGDESRNQQFHNKSLIQLSTRHIEQQVFLHSFRNTSIIHFHPREEFLGLSNDALLALDDNGNIIACNGLAPRFLDLSSTDDLTNRHINEILPLSQQFLEGNENYHSQNKGKFVRDLGETERGFFVSLNSERPSKSRTHTLVTQKSSIVTIQPPESKPKFDLDSLAGADSNMQKNVRNARAVLDKPVFLLLLGETGSGKEMFAHALHQSSKRSKKLLIAKNCAAIPEPLIESELFGHLPGAFTGANPKGMKGCIVESDGGTLFLDEIGDMPLSMQSRLLRVLETKMVQPLGSTQSIAVDLQVISSTNHDIEALIRDGQFRQDLYYRLNGITLTLSSLRNHEDIETQIRRMFDLENSSKQPIKIKRSAYEKLASYHWPGNFRELKNTVRLILSLAGENTISEEHLPASVHKSRDESNAPNEKEERESLINALHNHHWNMSQTAKSLEISRSTLYRKLEKFNIQN